MLLDEAIHVLDLCRDFLGGEELETMDILGGEPLLWPPLQNYIEVLLQRGIKPWVFTNMIAITPEMAEWLHEHEVHVTGKLNINPNDTTQLPLQAEMIGSKETLAQKMLDAISIFTNAGYCDPLFRLQNLIRKKNLFQVPAYYRWCLQHNIGVDLELMACGEGIDQDYWNVAPTPEEIRDTLLTIQEIRQREFNLPPLEVRMPHGFGACPFYDKGLFFQVDGGIRACSNSTVPLSHVNDSDPIGTAWNSELLHHRRCLTQETVGGPCNMCEKWDSCRGGCRATAEAEGPYAGYSICPVPLMTSSA